MPQKNRQTDSKRARQALKAFLGKPIERATEASEDANMSVSAHVFGPYPNGKKWRIVVKEGQARKSVCVATREEAERLKADLLRTVSEQGPTRIGVALEDYLEAKRQQGARAVSLRTMESRLRLFLPLEESIGALTPARAQALYEKETQRIARFGRTVTATTHRGTLKLAKTFFRWALERRLVRANPFESVKPVGKPSAGKRQLRIDEARKLYEWLFERAHSGDEGSLALLLQLLLGLRSSEVLQRVARDLDDGGRVLWIPHGKTHNARRRLEVPEELRVLLLRQIEGAAPERPIFPGEDGRHHYNSWIFRRMRLACEGAGVPSVCPHSLRGLHSTLALEAGATSGLVASALGHGSFEITAKHYADPSTLRNAAVRRVSSALGARPKVDVAALAETLRALAPADLDAVLASVGARR
jgi:integrase